MKTVWKYELLPKRVTELEMPMWAVALAVGTEPVAPPIETEGLVLWALVDPEVVRETRRFAVVGTGHKRDDLPDDGYVGTAVMDGPPRLVWHVFDITEHPF